MTPELVKAFAEAGMALTVVIVSGYVGIRLIAALFNFTSGQSSNSSKAWGDSIDLLQQAWAENTTAMREQTGAIRDLRSEIKEDRRFWVQQNTNNMDAVLREIRREAFMGAAKAVTESSQNIGDKKKPAS